MARMAQLLSCRKSTTVFILGSAGTQTEGASRGPQEVDVDELVTVRECPVRTVSDRDRGIGQAPPWRHGSRLIIMITPLRVEGQPQEAVEHVQEANPLPPGLHVLHGYTCLKNSSSKVSLVVRNVSDSHIFLKKGVPVVRVMSASPVLPTELSPEMEATLDVESGPEPMSVAARQEKLQEN